MKKIWLLLIQRVNSFKYAFNGFKILVKEEHNARIHLLAAVIAILAGFIFKVTALEWVALIFAIALVIITEIINTSIENIADFISPNRHKQIKRIKDLSAAAVLIAAIFAVIIGGLIFFPKMVQVYF